MAKKLPDRYNLIYVDQTTEEMFSLEVTPAATFIRGTMTGPEACELLEQIRTDLIVEDLDTRLQQ